MAPKFSIVVPTRNRSATLRHTLRTCLDQTFDDFEVVVTDNFSDDDTREVVAALADRRIKYVRTSSYISMSRNFANGLKHASGDAIIFIGDDDGMLPFGLELLDRILTDNPGVDAVRWHPPFFWWPGGRDFQLNAPFSDFNRQRNLEKPEEIWPRVTHPSVLSFFDMTGFTIYHGCWRRRMVERAQAENADVFNGPIPDVLASIYGLGYARSCLLIETPASIQGVSKKSNGWAQSAVAPTEDQKAIRDDFSVRSAQDFPDTPPITFVYTANAPYFGSLLTYWVRTHGTLEEFDHESWRLIYLDQAVTLYPENADDLCARYNAFVPWLIAHGAQNPRPITPEDRDQYAKSGRRLPTAAEHATPPRPSLWSILTSRTRIFDADVRIVDVIERKDAFCCVARVSAGEFTIAHFARLYAELFGVPVAEIARHAASDARALQQRALASILRLRLKLKISKALGLLN